MRYGRTFLVALLVCGATLVSSAQTDKTDRKKNKRKSEQVVAKPTSQTAQNPTQEFENLAAVTSDGKPTNLRFMQEHRIIKRGESTRFKWVFKPGYLSRISVQGVGESTPKDMRKGVYVVTVKPDKTTKYQYTLMYANGSNTGHTLSFTVIVVAPEEYDAVRAKYDNMSDEQRDLYIRKLSNEKMDPMEELFADKLLQMSKEEATEFVDKMSKMSDNEIEELFNNLMNEKKNSGK